MKDILLFENIWVVAGCPEGDLKFEYDNRLIQICTGGQWGYICAKNNYQWSKEEAQVACQQMGNMSNYYTGRVEIFWC